MAVNRPRLLPRLLVLLCIELAAGQKPIVLTLRPPGESFRQVSQGIRNEVEEEFIVHEILLNRKRTAHSIFSRIDTINPDAVVAMDNEAIDLFRTFEQQHPADTIAAIACMGVDIPSAIDGLRNATGVSYEIPIVTALVNLRLILQRPVSRIGILHRPFLQKFIEENRPYCERENFMLITRQLPAAAKLTPRLLKTELLAFINRNRLDALWIPNDNKLLTPDRIKNAWAPVVQSTNIPAVAGVSVLVNPGVGVGAFAVLPDHKALGSQIAQVIYEGLDNGWQYAGRSVEPPLSVKKHLNFAMAEKTGGLRPNAQAGVDTVLMSDSQRGFLLRRTTRGASELSLGDLLNMQVTSVTKKTESLRDVATSIYVITREDIRRSGATRLQDVLNLVPGAFVSSMTYTSTNVLVREASEVTAMSVNVLLDGVPVLNPIIGGVFYEGLHVPLAEIERIEVIKGPGGTIYGANSATGIINIITKNAHESEGLYLEHAQGYPWFASQTARFGSKLSESTALSGFITGKYHTGFPKNPDFVGDTLYEGKPDVDTIQNRFNDDEEGISYGLTAGLDFASQVTERVRFTGYGLYTSNRIREYTSLAAELPNTIVFAQPSDSFWLETTKFDNFILKGRVDLSISDRHSLFMHVYHYNYLDVFMHSTGSGSIVPNFSVTEFEIQENIAFFDQHPISLEIIGGTNLRMIHFKIDTASTTQQIFVDPVSREYLGALFLQDKVSFFDFIDVTTGLKAEIWTLIDDYPHEAWEKRTSAWDFLKSYPEYSPNIRLAVKPTEDLTFWGAWSRAVTTPAYVHTNMELRRNHIPPAWAWAFTKTWQSFDILDPSTTSIPDSLSTPPGAGKWVALKTTEDLEPTEFKTAELGFRTSLLENSIIDISSFYSRFKNNFNTITPENSELVYQTAPSRVIPGDTIIPIYWTNDIGGESYGLESILRSNPFDFLTFELSYSLFFWNIRKKDTGSLDGRSPDGVPRVPRHIGRTRFYFDLLQDIYITINTMIFSEFDNSHPYNYTRQKQDTENGESREKVAPGFKIDISVEKHFLDEKLSLMLWGKNLTASNTIESYYWYVQTYPHTVHRTFGLNISYSY
ncbi:MAG: TonB-dependent receptor plug domain-containing protein [Chitinivibrionales bacterium]|nr:TonB-dependent receptor plug domain-containing protein [Chitinivibrionales bacterium]